MEVGLLKSQVFFPASLEIQEELLKAGFKVPYDKESGRKTPVPVVVSSKEPRKVRESRLLKVRNYESDGKLALLPEERGCVWEDGKPSEITLKLSTTEPRIRIQGLYGELIGKSRGELTRTDDWYIVVHAEDFTNALHRVMSAFG